MNAIEKLQEIAESATTECELCIIQNAIHSLCNKEYCPNKKRSLALCESGKHIKERLHHEPGK